MLAMAIVLQLSKHLIAPPTIAVSSLFFVRNFNNDNDIDHFLRLRGRAFAREKVGVRQWDEADFDAEITSKAWWTPERTWFAVKTSDEGAPQTEQPIGTVTLAQRGVGPDSQPAIHWLAVDPLWRRHGVARLLIEHVEVYCWREGFREVCLETHAGWTAAAAFYESLGYRPT